MDALGAVPASFQVSRAPPEGIRCFRRQMKCPASAMNEVGPASNFNVFIETSTPGSFVDPQSAYMQFDLEVTNTNFMIDFMHMGPEGVGGALIDELKIYNQGSPLEEIHEYGTVASLYTQLEADMQMETHMFFSNRLKDVQNHKLHKNFVKPAMCDSSGNIMYGLNPHGLGFNSESYDVTLYKNRGVDSTAGPDANTWIGGARPNEIDSGVNTKSIGGSVFPLSDDQHLQRCWINQLDADIIQPQYCAGGGPKQPTPMDWPDFYSAALSEKVKDNYIQEFGSICKPQIMANLANVKCIPIGMVPTQNCYGQTSSATAQSYGTFANNFFGAVGYDGSGQTTLTRPTVNEELGIIGTPPAAVAFRYRINYQLISGFLGRLATKVCPTLLMGPQQTYINIKTSTIERFFKVASDPCRRISGTIRDYVRNIGQRNGAYWGELSYTATGVGNVLGTVDPTGNSVTAFAPGYGLTYHIPLQTQRTSTTDAFADYVSAPNSVFAPSCSNGLTEYIECGSGTQIVGASIQLDQDGVLYALDTDIAGRKIQPGMSFSIYVIDALSGFPSGSVVSGIILGPYMAKTHNPLPGGGNYPQNGGTALTYMTNARLHQNLVGDNTTILHVYWASARIPAPPAPQYVLCKEPWKFKIVTANRQISQSDNDPAVAFTSAWTVQYATENQVFYGTRLRSSVPQSKRMFQFSTPSGQESSVFTSTSGSYGYNGGLSYKLTNINFVADQLILPDEVTKDVLTMAEAGQYRIATKSVKTYVTQPNTGASTQTMILPLKVGKAQQLFCVFKNVEQRSATTGFYYNSFCGYNIFSSIHAGAANTNASIEGYQNATRTGGLTTTTLFGVGYTDPLTYIPTQTGKGQFQVQLRIGSDYFPLNPIDSLTELSAEYCKTLQGWTDHKFSPDIHGVLSGAMVTAGVAKAPGTLNTSASAFDCLKPSMYTTAFVNAALLDDQTITGNVDMVPLYSNFDGTSKCVDTVDKSSANGYRWLCPRGYCVPNMFEAPDGRFALGFNFLSFNPKEGIMGGKYLGNSTITLQLTGAVGLQQGNWECVSVVPHRVMIQFGSGGQVIWNS